MFGYLPANRRKRAILSVSSRNASGRTVSIIDYNLNALKKFIINSFEIRSSQSSVSSIAEDVEFIQLSAFSRCAGAHGA